ncbi:hypothetical protein HQ584_08920 [Patescibacteria group bacterium]|nr:hypothetical protein [Patescibacteria group bacterium]
MTQDVSLFGKIKQSGQWWLNPWWLKEDSKYTKNQIIIAFQKLKKTFDDKWFRSQFGRSNPHPIWEDLFGSFPFVLDDLVKLGLDLKEIENCKNVDRVIKNLKSASEYLSTRSVIEVSAELKRKRFDIFFEPEVTIKTTKYNPDFYTENKNGIIYFEIKTLYTSAKERVKSELMDKVYQSLTEKFRSLSFQVDLETCPDFWKKINVGKIDPFHQLPMDIITTLDHIAKNIAQSVIKIGNSGELPCKVEIEKVIITIKRSENKTHLRIGRSLRSLESEFKRAIRNLVKKARKQLPPDNPGIIGIKLFTLEPSFKGNRDLALEFFLTEFQNSPPKYAHIVGIILILNSYPVQYEKRIIMNPYTKFKTIGKNCGIF